MMSLLICVYVKPELCEGSQSVITISSKDTWNKDFEYGGEAFQGYCTEYSILLQCMIIYQPVVELLLNQRTRFWSR